MNIKDPGVIPRHPVRKTRIESRNDFQIFEFVILEFTGPVYRGESNVAAHKSEIDTAVLERVDISGGAGRGADIDLDGRISISYHEGDRLSDRIHRSAAVGSSDRKDL